MRLLQITSIQVGPIFHHSFLWSQIMTLIVHLGKLLASISNFPQKIVIALAHTLDYLSKFDLAEVLMQTEFFSKFTESQHMLLNANTLSNLSVVDHILISKFSCKCTDFRTTGRFTAIRQTSL